MNLYTYKGAVKEFGKMIEPRWEGYTYAVSEAKARCNLAFQYKKQTNRMVNAKIGLPGKIECVIEDVSKEALNNQLSLFELFPEVMYGRV